MEFLPLYFAKDLILLAPQGDIGILTLWSRPDWVFQQIEKFEIETSRIAAIGTLYGNGLPELLRNLLYNPQIQHLIVGGRDRSGSKKELFHFFQEGVEEVTCLGAKAHQIKGTNRKVDLLMKPELFENPPQLHEGEKLEGEHLKVLLAEISEKKSEPKETQQFHEKERQKIPLPEIQVSMKPSNLRGHTVMKQTPLEAWKELVFRGVHFGREVQLKKGKRRELQNVKVLIEKPQEEAPEDLKQYGFDFDYLKRYQDEFISPFLPNDTEYTYGNRLQSYFGFKTLEQCGELLQQEPECRSAYISLWDTAKDLPGTSHPCLVSIFFRKEEKLNLTATFRTHNIMDAWIPNTYGLMRVLQKVSEYSKIPPGVLTLFSQSISIDVARLEEARQIAEAKLKKNTINWDPGGDFKVTVEGKNIVVRHLFEGVLIKEYRSVKAQVLQHQIAKDEVIFDLNHALYLGRQLANAQWCIQTNCPFKED